MAAYIGFAKGNLGYIVAVLFAMNLFSYLATADASSPWSMLTNYMKRSKDPLVNFGLFLYQLSGIGFFLLLLIAFVAS